jgi:hypothetical protein
MFTLVLGSILGPLALLAAPAGQVQGPEALADVDGAADVVTLDFGPDGSGLADVLTVFQQLLAMPIDSLPDEVTPVVIHVAGPQRIEPGRARDLLDSLLERHGFWCWDDVSGGEPQLVVRSREARRKPNEPLPFTPRVVSLEELVAGPRPRTPLYTVTFPIRHLNARDLLVVLQAGLDLSCETMRCTESNTLIVAAARARLLHVRDILAAADVPAAGQPAAEDTPEARREAALRYLEVNPLSDLMADMATKVAATLPEEARAPFVQAMTEELDLQPLQDAMVESLAKRMTLAEIHALHAFYASAEGKSVMKKLSDYMADVMPIIQEEVGRALGRAMEK